MMRIGSVVGFYQLNGTYAEDRSKVFNLQREKGAIDFMNIKSCSDIVKQTCNSMHFRFSLKISR
jgi:hypothetical protein